MNSALCPSLAQFAVQSGHAEIVDALIDAGADVNWATGAGLTPWMIAKASEHSAIETKLLENGAVHGTEAAIWITGELPLKALAERLIPNYVKNGSYTRALGYRLSDRFMGAYHIDRLDPGMDAEEYSALLAEVNQHDKKLVFESSVGSGEFVCPGR
jgi:hypothetical protein